MIICFLIICIIIYKEKYLTFQVKDFPLSVVHIQKAIKKCQFPNYIWIEENEVSDPLTSSLFSLRCPDNELDSGEGLCMGIMSRKAEQGCSLGITVLSIDETEELTEKEIKQSIWLATYLFWNGKNNITIRNKFFEDFSSTEDYSWKDEIDGVDCEIIYQPEAGAKLLISFLYETN